jgi:hypothetical protein
LEIAVGNVEFKAAMADFVFGSEELKASVKGTFDSGEDGRCNVVVGTADLVGPVFKGRRRHRWNDD